LNNHYTYLLIHLLSLAGPFALSFDKKVHFYKKWKFVFPAMIIPAVVFIIWDDFFTRTGVWDFSSEHTIGWKLGSLPIEEVLFFITVPYCCLFIYECIRCYFPELCELKWADRVLWMIAFILLVASFMNIDKAYTAYTFILNALFIAVIYLFKKFFKGFDAASFLVAYLIIIIPFLIVNGFLTAIPVVLYNDAENLGIRIFSFLPHPLNNIPFEDIFYGMLLIIMNVTFYEKIKSIRSTSKSG
jgi:lycopene cyclase domain-containing protein